MMAFDQLIKLALEIEVPENHTFWSFVQYPIELETPVMPLLPHISSTISSVSWPSSSGSTPFKLLSFNPSSSSTTRPFCILTPCHLSAQKDSMSVTCKALTSAAKCAMYRVAHQSSSRSCSSSSVHPWHGRWH